MGKPEKCCFNCFYCNHDEYEEPCVRCSLDHDRWKEQPKVQKDDMKKIYGENHPLL